MERAQENQQSKDMTLSVQQASAQSHCFTEGPQRLPRRAGIFPGVPTKLCYCTVVQIAVR